MVEVTGFSICESCGVRQRDAPKCFWCGSELLRPTIETDSYFVKGGNSKKGRNSKK